MAPSKSPILLDGSTGEGGGQLVRMAVALSAVTGEPIKITNIRANRAKTRPVGKKGRSTETVGGGLKNQHVAGIKWMAEATNATVEGLTLGSRTLTFIPTTPPTALASRTIKIVPDSAASSAMLVFQAVLPFLLYAASGKGDDGAESEPIHLEIQGGTNTSWSLSYEYMDQVLMPTLEARFGIRVERAMKSRGWSQGPPSRGCCTFKIHPIKRRTPLTLIPPERPLAQPADYEARCIDVNLVVPLHLQEPLQTYLAGDLETLFPGAEINFRTVEDSGHGTRVYVLLVAKCEAGLRWGRDILFTPGKKSTGTSAEMAAAVSRLVTKELFEELQAGGSVDRYLQDQLVCFQALAEGRTSFPRHGHGRDDDDGNDGDDKDPHSAVAEALGELEIGDDHGDRMRREKTHEPFGHGSMHSRTARWVAAQLLPSAKFFNKGDFVEGAGVKFE